MKRNKELEKNNENTVQRAKEQPTSDNIMDQEERVERPALLLTGIPKVKNGDNEEDGIYGTAAKMILRVMKDGNPQVWEE